VKKELNTKKTLTIILQKPSGTIAIAGKLTKWQKKIYNTFLYAAKQQLSKDPNKFIFNIRMADIKKFLNTQEKDKNNLLIKETIKTLHETNVTYNVLGKDYYIEGYASLLDNIEFITDLKTGNVIVNFSIPYKVRNAFIKKRSVYASIDLMIIKGLNSVHSITLYELVKDYENAEIPKMTIQKLREIFGITDKYPRIYDLKKNVLDVACNELNNNNNINFYVNYKLYSKGRKYTHIKFVIKEKDKYLNHKNVIYNNIDKLLNLVQKEYRNKKSIYNAIEKYLREKGFEYVKRNIQYTNEYATENYRVFLQKALKNDWGKEWWEDNKEQKAKQIKQMPNSISDSNKLERKQEENIRYTLKKFRNKKVEIDGKIYQTDQNGNILTKNEVISAWRVFVLLQAKKAKIVE